MGRFFNFFLLQMPETTTRILLSHCKWDTQGLLEKLTGNDRDDLFEKAHVLNPFKKSPRKKTSRKHVECIICYSKFIPSVSKKLFFFLVFGHFLRNTIENAVFSLCSFNSYWLIWVVDIISAKIAVHNIWRWKSLKKVNQIWYDALNTIVV